VIAKIKLLLGNDDTEDEVEEDKETNEQQGKEESLYEGPFTEL
jgi:hypothetical protein